MRHVIVGDRRRVTHELPASPQSNAQQVVAAIAFSLLSLVFISVGVTGTGAALAAMTNSNSSRGSLIAMGVPTAALAFVIAVSVERRPPWRRGHLPATRWKRLATFAGVWFALSLMFPPHEFGLYAPVPRTLTGAVSILGFSLLAEELVFRGSLST